MELLGVSYKLDLDACEADGASNPVVERKRHTFEELVKLFENGRRLPLQDVVELLTEEIKLAKTRDRLVTLKGSQSHRRVFAIGDLHSGYTVFLQFFAEALKYDNWTFVLMGNYLNKGVNGCELLILLLTLRRHYPDRVILRRGLHETQPLTDSFEFRKECVGKYGEYVYNLFLRLLVTLSLACYLETDYGDILFVHGGLSPHFATTVDIAAIKSDKDPDMDEPSALLDILAGDLYPASFRSAAFCCFARKTRNWDLLSNRNCRHILSSFYPCH